MLASISLLNTLLFSGIFFGWSSFQLMLVGEGQFSRLCANDVINCPARGAA